MKTTSVSSIYRTLIASFLLSSVTQAHACTLFQFTQEGAPYVAKNHDYMFDEGILIVNTRGRMKFGFGSEQPFRWSARFGSVTYNQYGREFPNGGMNESGLVVEMLWLSGTRYSPPEGRATLPLLQWIQFQLDTASTVAEVLASDDIVRIAEVATAHIFLTDREGCTAVIEWSEGKREVYTESTLPVAALANDRYEECAHAWQNIQIAERTPALTLPSFGRFAAVAAGTKLPSKRVQPTDHGFRFLDRAKDSTLTVYQIVYAPVVGTLVIKRKADPTPVFVSLSDLDFSPTSATRSFDLTRSGAFVWSDWTPELNRELVLNNCRRTSFLAHLDHAVFEEIAALPERFTPAP